MTKLHINPISVIYHLVKNDIHELEYNSKVQLRINIVMARFWVANGIAVLLLNFLNHGLWIKESILYLALVSIYDSWVGHYTGIPASFAAMKAQEIQNKQESDTRKSTAEHADISHAIAAADF